MLHHTESKGLQIKRVVLETLANYCVRYTAEMLSAFLQPNENCLN